MELETILQLDQKSLKAALKLTLKELGYSKVISQKGYLYAEGDHPVLLAAHLDTVHRESPEILCYSRDSKFVMSPQGIGGDDRAGVYMILQIIQSCRCHVVFLEDEEIGGIGANYFTKSKLRPEINYIVEMDRQGSNDAVFYNCDNQEFTDFVCGFGFRHAYGTYSDIATIAPYLKVAAVNISAGYYNAHRLHEIIDLQAMEQNIRRILEMVQIETNRFPYVEMSRRWDRSSQMSLWGTMASEESHARSLMKVPDTATILINGEQLSDSSIYMIDCIGNVYLYIPSLTSAILSENTEVYGTDSRALRFKSKDSKRTDIISVETAYELLEVS